MSSGGDAPVGRVVEDDVFGSEYSVDNSLVRPALGDKGDESEVGTECVEDCDEVGV